MTPRFSVDASLPGITGIINACKGDAIDAPEFDVMRTRWLARYETFVRRRFNDFGRGGGDWPALAISTIQSRRGPARGRGGKGGGSAGGKGSRTSLARDTSRGGALVGAGRSVTILANTGMLRNALQLGAAGNFAGNIPAGVEFGFDGTRHRGSGSGAATIAQIAGWHNSGTARMPQRLILAEPDQRTARAMSEDLTRAVLAIGRRSALAAGRPA